MRRAIVHLGLPKCGSTALQVRLRANAAKALELGSYVPLQHRVGKSGRAGVGMGHMKLATELATVSKGQPRPSPILEGFVRDFDASGASTLILSSESLASRLSWIKPEALAPLGELAIELVLFTRRADAHAVSAYKHLVRKKRHTGSFAEFVAESERPQTRRAAMNIATTMRHAQRLFPGNTFHLFDLDAQGGDSIALFAQVSGLPLTDWGDNLRPKAKSRNVVLQNAGHAINQSHSDAKTLFLLACNRSDLGAKALGEIDRALPQVPDLPPDPRRILSASESRRLLDAHRQQNREVETEFGFALFDRAPMAVPEEARTTLSREEAEVLVAALEPLLTKPVAKRLREVTF